MMTIINTRLSRQRVIGYLLCAIVTFSSGYIYALFSRWETCMCSSREARHSLKSDRHSDHSDQSEHSDRSRLVSVDQTFLIVVIFSALANEERRVAIRETWLRLAGDRKCRHYFVVGTLDVDETQLNAIYSEQRVYNDLILFSHLKDTYTTLSHKLLSTLKWFSNKIEFKYLLKVDDDSFVQLDIIFDDLLEKKPKEDKLYWGYFDGRAHVKRGGHWAENKWTLCDRYLPYALGGGYVLSQQLVNFVAKNADLFELYRNEDVSLGVWLSPLSINRVHDIRFDTEYQTRGCINNHIITHKQSEHNMRTLYKNLQTFGKLCKNENELQLAYHYNWKVLPSQCCVRNITIKSFT